MSVTKATLGGHTVKGTLRRKGGSLSGHLAGEVLTHEQREFLAGRRSLMYRGPLCTADGTVEVDLEVFCTETTAGRETRTRHFVKGRPIDRVTTTLKASIVDAEGHAEQQLILARVRAMYPKLDT